MDDVSVLNTIMVIVVVSWFDQQRYVVRLSLA